MAKYYPPTDQVQQFNCIHCGVYASQEWYKLLFCERIMGNGYVEINSRTTSPVTCCVCKHCQKRSYWNEGKMIIPADSPVEPPHADMPASLVEDYKEARAVFGRSPRAAVALLRLVTQKLMIELGGKGKNISDDIQSLMSKGLPVDVQQALDCCRVIGNNAVHPGEINLNDTPEIGQSLFGMLNFIVGNQITQPQKIASLYSQLPDSSLTAIEKRNTKSASPKPKQE